MSITTDLTRKSFVSITTDLTRASFMFITTDLTRESFMSITTDLTRESFVSISTDLTRASFMFITTDLTRESFMSITTDPTRESFVSISTDLIVIFLLNAEKSRSMPPKSRTIPAALNLCPEVNLLTEFALIATSPQSPLVREVSGENADVSRSGRDSPPPQLVDPKQMVCNERVVHSSSL